MRSLNVSPPPACGVLRAASHRLDRTRRPRIPGAEDQEGALPGEAGSGWKSGGSVGESRPRGQPCHPRHLQPRSVEHGTHIYTHTDTQCRAAHIHKTWRFSSVIFYKVRIRLRWSEFPLCCSKQWNYILGTSTEVIFSRNDVLLTLDNLQTSLFCCFNS